MTKTKETPENERLFCFSHEILYDRDYFKPSNSTTFSAAMVRPETSFPPA